MIGSGDLPVFWHILTLCYVQFLSFFIIGLISYWLPVTNVQREKRRKMKRHEISLL